MKKFRPLLFILIRIALGAIFIAAAAPKIWRPDEFADSINNYRILPYFLVNLSAITLPWVEMLFGLFLVLGFRVKAASLATTIMMVAFLAALISAYARGINIDCGCRIPLLTSKETVIGWREFLRDAIFLAMSLLVYLRRRPAPPVPRIG
jgi:uncharacterized membrane protein YphA (DoxX/SURF4 family)